MENTSIITYLNQETVLENIRNTVGDRTPQFITSVASLVNSNPKLLECDRKSLLSACLVATALDLPINQNLGFAYIIPYVGKAQFQLGYKGFIQLAQRSGQFKTINATDVREGELVSINRLTGEIEFDWKDDRSGLQTIGYVAYMELLNGFSKSLYMTLDELKRHATKYSKSYVSGNGTNLWKDDFDVMAKKTVVKLLLSRYAPMSTQMQTAQIADQAVIENDAYDYVDNYPEPEAIPINQDEIDSVFENVKKGK